MKTMMRHRGLRLVAAFGLLLAICACGGGDGGDDSPPPPSVAPVAPVAPPPTAPAMPTPPAGGTTLISLSTGFMPDPHTASGTAGGTMMASTLDANCRGNIPNAPQHTLMLATAFNSLAIMTNSSADTTLVIRQPDGTYRCDDDSGGNFHPRVDGTWAAGTYQVWVGVFAGTPTSYTIGLTELSHVTASSLPLP